MMNTTRRRSRGRSQAGFSMIEVLAAVLLVSFGILGLLSLLARASQASVGSEDTLRAALLANEMTSLMWAAGSVSGVAAGDITAWQTRISKPDVTGLPSGAGAISNITAHKATITITWSPNNTGHTANDTRTYTTDVVIP